MRKWLPLSLLIFSQVLKEACLESGHREGLVAFVVTEVLTEASRLQTGGSRGEHYRYMPPPFFGQGCAWSYRKITVPYFLE